MAKKKKKGFFHHPEAKGLFLFALSMLFFVSLISFIQGSPSVNFLGIIGYGIGWGLQYLFGLGSYLLIAYLLWCSGTLLFQPKSSPFGWQLLYFSIFLFSICTLLSAVAETYPHKAILAHERIYTEILYVAKKAVYRFNLGGVPAYYLYKDLPYFHLQKLFSNFGVFLIFSLTGLISFLLLTGITLSMLFQATAKTFRILKQFSFEVRKILKVRAEEKKPILKEAIAKKIPAPLKKPVVPKPIVTRPEPEEEEIAPPVNIHARPKKQQESLITSLSDALTKSIDMHKSPYALPSIDLLTDAKKIDHPTLKKDLAKQAKILEETLKSFSVDGKVVEINCGPTITSFEVQPPIGVKVQKIKALESDIALNMEAKSIRILAPIPGKAVVGVEIPALHPQEVSFKELLSYYQEKNRKLQIPILMGKTVNGEYVVSDLVKMPHCLIAGATGSGKSVCINTIVMSILMNASPDEIKLVMIDPKKVELTQYTNLPHMIAPVISEAHGAYAAMQWLVREMHVRYDILKALGLRNITAFNSRKPKKEVEEALSIPVPEKMPLIVAIIDEFADLMMVSSSDLETPIARIAQMARAVGIHLVLATQRPSREVITGIIKANFPTRIAFKVSSRINSQIILDEVGAESLLGNGDLLFLPPGSSSLVRAQGAYISDDDINKVVETICASQPPNYLIKSFDSMKKEETVGSDEEHEDDLYKQALNIVLASKNASTTFLQRKLKIGYARAASIIDELEQNGVIGPQEGSKPRRILKSSIPSFEENQQG